MNEQKEWDDPVKSPEIQLIILSNRIGMISAKIAEELEIEPWRALELFYESKTCERLHDRSTGLYIYSDLYIVEDFMNEKRYIQ